MSWRDNLLQASFRGAKFYCVSHETTTGRRTVTHEFPLRDTPQGEDLGRLRAGYNIQAYVLGDDYFADRDALIAACSAKSVPGQLVHPWLGKVLVRCESIAIAERI